MQKKYTRSVLNLEGFCCLLLIASAPLATGSGAGRAFPVEAENYVTNAFTRINPGIEWDPTNFLVDLSGLYANCRYAGSSKELDIKELTPEGQSIAGVVDYTQGSGTDVDSVNNYVRHVVNEWVRFAEHHDLIRNARRFGCSVRPGCTGLATISCLFSPGKKSNEIKPIPNPPGGQDALAFTREQYDLAEMITKNRWDRSHYLENLSGYETDCAMVNSRNWQFTKMTTMAKGLRLTGLYGSAPNRGSTEDALVDILEEFKQVGFSTKVGCSIIPDCVVHGQMYVVVSCLYEEV